MCMHNENLYGCSNFRLNKQWTLVWCFNEGAKHQHFQTPQWKHIWTFFINLSCQLTINSVCVCVCVCVRGWSYWILNELCLDKNEFGWVKIRERNSGVWNCDQLCCFIIVMKLKARNVLNGKKLVLCVYGFWYTHWVNVSVIKKIV
jgi:hypothetical protein